MRKRLLPLLSVFLCTLTHADGPRYQVFTQLGGMTISYYVESTNIETTLYAINHDRVPVICDAKMITNRQETSKGQDTPVAPEKTATFSFRHGKSITDVRLYLMCEADKNAKADVAPTPSTTDKNTAPAKNTAPLKSIPVVEEDLDRY